LVWSFLLVGSVFSFDIQSEKVESTFQEINHNKKHHRAIIIFEIKCN